MAGGGVLPGAGVGGVGQTPGVLWSSVPSPVGDLGVAVDGEHLLAVRFGGIPAEAAAAVAASVEGDDPGLSVLAEVVRQLAGYFDGDHLEFDLPVLVRHGSTFERSVWAAISAIPHGETLTYGEIARSLGDPLAARAVGVACNRNPLPIVVPCHRVVGAGGRLVGFGGGLERKRTLLDLEARMRLVRDFGMP